MADNNHFAASFNDSLGLIQQIDSLLCSATTNYINSNLTMAWRNIRAIQARIIQLCSDDEVKELNKAADISGKYIAAIKYMKDNNKYINIVTLAERYYENYNELIMKKLHSSHLLLQAKKDATRMNF